MTIKCKDDKRVFMDAFKNEGKSKTLRLYFMFQSVDNDLQYRYKRFSISNFKKIIGWFEELSNDIQSENLVFNSEKHKLTFELLSKPKDPEKLIRITMAKQEDKNDTFVDVVADHDYLYEITEELKIYLFDNQYESKAYMTYKLKSKEYLRANIFYGLEALKKYPDIHSSVYFSEAEFEIVLDRVEKNGIAIYGIEPMDNGEYCGCEVFELYRTNACNPKWYRMAFEKFKRAGYENLLYYASYGVPRKLLPK